MLQIPMMILDELAVKNEYIIHELIKFLEPQSLRNLRQTSRTMEYILSTNSKFVKEAFYPIIFDHLEFHHEYVSYDTKYLRQFIFERKSDAVEKYHFATKLINISERTKDEWKYHQSHVSNQSAATMLRKVQNKMKDNCERFTQIAKVDEHFGELDRGTWIVNMRKHLLAISLEIADAEDDLYQIINVKEHLRPFDGPRSWGLKREPDPDIQSYLLRHLAIYSANILFFLLEEIRKIQNTHKESLK